MTHKDMALFFLIGLLGAAVGYTIVAINSVLGSMQYSILECPVEPVVKGQRVDLTSPGQSVIDVIDLTPPCKLRS